MKSRYTSILLFLILFLSFDRAFAQHNIAEKQFPLIVKKDITFLIRKPDNLKDIAIRFHTPIKLLVRLNRPIRKKHTLYAGKKLVIPVWLKRKADATASDYTMTDYTLDMDSLDEYVKEDFISLADIESDTIRRMAIDKEVKKIDKKIAGINSQMDSLENEGRRNLSNREIRKLPMDRARRIGPFTIGHQIDSLTAQRKKILEEKSKIDLRLADYEYLVDNASYMASHRGEEDKTLIQIQESWDFPVKKSGGKKKNIK